MMVKTLVSDMNDDFIILKESITYVPREDKSLDKFIKWMKRKEIKPGDIIPNRIFKKYWRVK